ncbi:hypothetical protein [Diaminobutyricimonas sp. LJ205]|uniref:hypothetical protein n=1 Tax=Diaminobutyricimonas sp. LJ205 TaxID=2683590 RepID=UPI0012F4D68C|nr:hypothetical protein [Diaminobutyricimonas sp. LJ205]
MRSITQVALAIASAAAITTVIAMPASAAPVEDTTTTTVEVTAGALSISAPASLALSSVTPGGSATGTFQSTDVVVTDLTADTLGWTTSYTIGEFSSVLVPAGTIAASNVTYTPTVAIVDGTATVTEATASNGTGVIQTATAVTGNNTATWGGTITVTVPSDALAAADYTATLTHSVL